MKDDEKQSFLENNSNERTKERLIVKEDQVFVTNMDIDVDVEDQLEKKKKDDDILSFLKISSNEKISNVSSKETNEHLIVNEDQQVFETTMDIDVDEEDQLKIIVPNFGKNSLVKRIIINVNNVNKNPTVTYSSLGKRKKQEYENEEIIAIKNKRPLLSDFIKNLEDIQEEEELTSLKLIIEDKLKGLMKNKAKD